MTEAIRKKAATAMSDYNLVPVKQHQKSSGKSGSRGQSNWDFILIFNICVLSEWYYREIIYILFLSLQVCS